MEEERLYEKLGYNMWKTPGTKGIDGKAVWYYITAHINPILEQMGDNTILLMCSCKSFTIGIPSDQGNPFITPCKHIQGFNEEEVSIESLESHTQSQGVVGVDA